MSRSQYVLLGLSAMCAALAGKNGYDLQAQGTDLAGYAAYLGGPALGSMSLAAASQWRRLLLTAFGACAILAGRTADVRTVAEMMGDQ